ncbi:phasin family protein [Niallia sp. NCCP-28]|uniref:phasin family protein n=1 Tax=Niallia sp. NCCP-28 TaxID=2934712 RepID=UPI0020869E83|nr:hypothetical protein [Niallia sp. NCCP-28]GKU81600.1 ATP synthase subunit B [Niallia sp. NCCP-28]
MKNTIGKALSLGLGLAIAGKEQVEKTVEELVKKGEVTKGESKELIEHLLRKGEEMKGQMEAIAREKVSAVFTEKGIATVEDMKRLEERIEALERKNADN